MQPSLPVEAKSARRAKSNTDFQSSDGCYNKKIRRLRSQRKAEAITKYVDRSIADIDNEDSVSHLSIGAKTNLTLTTPHRANVDSKIKLRSIREGSLLKQPTPIRKSSALRATLSRIDSQTKIDIDDLPYGEKTRTSQNSQLVSVTKSVTPGKMGDAPSYTHTNNMIGRTARVQTSSNTYRQRTTNAANNFGTNSSHTL